MFAKLLVIVVALGATACILLVNRQQRLDIAHEMSIAHRQTLRNERAIVELQRQIASACTPEQIRLAKNDLKLQWEPIPARPTTFMASAPGAAPSPVDPRSPTTPSDRP